MLDWFRKISVFDLTLAELAEFSCQVQKIDEIMLRLPIKIVILLFCSNVWEAFKLFADAKNSEASNSSDNHVIFDQVSSKVSKLKDPKLNCFGIHNELFANAIEDLFTQKTEAEDVRFYFYSRDSSTNVTVQNNRDFDVNDLPYKCNRKTVIITHGFMSSGTQNWVQEMKDAFLKLGDVNVIVVDWHKGSNTWNYVAASISTKIVGAEIAKLLTIVKDKILAVSPSEAKEFTQLYLVGHSLGAHISAHASHVLKELELKENKSTKFAIERISGLDPAQPCFSDADPRLKLDRTDAQYVDVIHTNADHILRLGFGLPDRLGHHDFYPNGGKIQLGCEKINATFWNFLLLPIHIVQAAICSHGRSHELLTDSIHTAISNECHFHGHVWNKRYENVSELVKPCRKTEVYSEMGIKSIKYHPDKDGTYFVPTSSKPHYCAVSNLTRKKIKNLLENDVEKVIERVI